SATCIVRSPSRLDAQLKLNPPASNRTRFEAGSRRDCPRTTRRQTPFEIGASVFEYRQGGLRGFADLSRSCGMLIFPLRGRPVRHEHKRRTVSDLADSTTSLPQVALSPPAVAQRYGADWGLIRPEQVDVI